jgi:hypothetical protein
MHAKTLIVDDEIAIIGSANVNRRSFTLVSETSAILFNEIPESDSKSADNFARLFRVATWKEFTNKSVPASAYRSWQDYPTAIARETSNFSQLVKYTKDLQDDLDVKIIDFIKAHTVIVAIAAYHLLDRDLSNTSAAINPSAITYIFDQVWEHFIDTAGPVD